MSKGKFDRDYYENGVASGKSLYTNYRWLPEMTIKFAHKIIRTLGINDGDTVLDFGCAKGYMVKALRILDVDSYGCDISEYAISNADSDVRDQCRLVNGDGSMPFNIKFKFVLCKDVLEHVEKKDLDLILEEMCKKADNLFAIVPLGKEGKYIIPAYHLDKTHVIVEDKDWWETKFEEHNWRLRSFSYLIPGMKDSWAKYPKGNGFFILDKTRN